MSNEKLHHHNASTAIDEALDRTKTLLWPPHLGIWIRIAIIALFLGGGAANPMRTDTISWSGFQGSDLPGPVVLFEHMDLLLKIGLGLLIAGLFYMVISAVFQFIFVDCLTTNTILLTRTFNLRWRKSLHLVGLYLFLFLVIALCFVLLAFIFIMPVFETGVVNLLNLLILIIITLLLLFIILIPVWIIAILTADFVVPIMIVDDCGIIAGWRRTIRLFSGRWVEAGIYTGLKLLLIFITGMIIGVIIFLISIPLGITGTIVSIEAGSPPVIDSTGAVLLGIGTLGVFLISLFLLVPVITFFRYYSLVVLRDMEPRYNLLPNEISS